MSGCCVQVLCCAGGAVLVVVEAFVWGGRREEDNFSISNLRFCCGAIKRNFSCLPVGLWKFLGQFAIPLLFGVYVGAMDDWIGNSWSMKASVGQWMPTCGSRYFQLQNVHVEQAWLPNVISRRDASAWFMKLLKIEEMRGAPNISKPFKQLDPFDLAPAMWALFGIGLVASTAPTSSARDVKLLPYLLGTAPRPEKWLAKKNSDERRLQLVCCCWRWQKN